MKVFMKKYGRTDMERHYVWSKYNKAMNDAKQHVDNNVPGVMDHVINARKEAEDYEIKLTQFLEMERVQESEKYNVYEKSVEKYNMCIWAGVGLIFLKIFLMIFAPARLNSLASLAIFAYIVVVIVLKVKASILEKKYINYSENVLRQIEQINAGFLRTIDVRMEYIDRLYLQSLDPVLRETVLMRREQAEYYRKQEEHNRKQAEYYRKQEEHNRNMENAENEKIDEARRTRVAQEDLLAIERERERRRYS